MNSYGLGAVTFTISSPLFSKNLSATASGAPSTSPAFATPLRRERLVALSSLPTKMNAASESITVFACVENTYPYMGIYLDSQPYIELFQQEEDIRIFYVWEGDYGWDYTKLLVSNSSRPDLQAIPGLQPSRG